MAEYILIALLVLLVWYWWNAISAKDTAREAALRACKISHTQLLDDAVAIEKQWLRRNEKGHIEICRIYFFDFTIDGNQRYHAYVLMLGRRIGRVSLDIDDMLHD